MCVFSFKGSFPRNLKQLGFLLRLNSVDFACACAIHAEEAWQQIPLCGCLRCLG